jgi:WD40 repeat protein
MTALTLLPSLALALAAPDASISVKSLKTVLGVRPIALAAGPFGARFAASLENNTIRVYDVINLKVVRVLTGHPQPAYAVAWHPKGQILATGDESARIFLWDIKTGAKIREMRTHIRGIQALSFDASGTRLLSTGKDDVVKVYDVKTGKELRSIPGNGANFYSGTYLPGGSFAVGTLGDGVRVYSGSGVAKKYSGHEDRAVWDFDFHAPSNRLITAGRDSTAIVWDLKGAKKLQTLRGHGDWVNHVRLTPNGRFGFTASTDRTVKIWDMKALRSIGTLENMSSVGSPICVTADGNYLIGVNLDDWLQVFTISPRQP